jgi:N-acetylglucosaminyldiphosphoundecaprenol N-acetyl-beta-D-mannosaminyltransferase
VAQTSHEAEANMGVSASFSSRPSRVRVDDLKFDRVTMGQAVRRIVRMAKLRDRARYVCTGNLDHLVIADRDPEFRAAYENADLVVADGAPVVWLSKLSARADAILPERVAGSDLFWEIAKASGETKLRVFLLGGVEGAADQAVLAIKKRYPKARIAGTYCPPFATFNTDEEQARIRKVVRAARPDILLVAFGAPKQEKWIVKNKDALGVPVSIGVGGSFEMAAGILERAPVWVQNIGMEWLYRFAQQPKRLFHRYFVDDLPYLAGATVRAVNHRLHEEENGPLSEAPSSLGPMSNGPLSRVGPLSERAPDPLSERTVPPASERDMAAPPGVLSPGR